MFVKAVHSGLPQNFWRSDPAFSPLFILSTNSCFSFPLCTPKILFPWNIQFWLFIAFSLFSFLPSPFLSHPPFSLLLLCLCLSFFILSHGLKCCICLDNAPTQVLYPSLDIFYTPQNNGCLPLWAKLYFDSSECSYKGISGHQ